MLRIYPFSCSIGKRSMPRLSCARLSSETKSESHFITPRSVDYSKWYHDVISHGDMADNSPVRGCMVIKPWAMGIWDNIRHHLDVKIKQTGTENAYFPLFFPKSFLLKEAEHVEGFAKECAVVTHHRLKLVNDEKTGALDIVPDPSAKLEEPLVVRPTSETIIWNMYAKWIHSYRDLPLQLNQWANIVRWEMRTRPFLRTSEFLWQEGHTAHATDIEAKKLTRDVLDMYASFCEQYLAIPTIKGVKSPSEKFAGAEETLTIEAMMQNGWALQSGTSHFLGQNFAKAFDVRYTNDEGGESFVWATSWGVSTRLIGAIVMTHSDDKGLILPPSVAPTQVVIVPIMNKDKELVLQEAKSLRDTLLSAGIRCKIDDRDYLRPGEKYFEWERKGLPLRIDLGPRDLKSRVVPVSIRHSGEKFDISLDNKNIGKDLIEKMDVIRLEMYQKAADRLQANIIRLNSYSEMKSLLVDSEKSSFYLVPWKCNAVNEEKIKEETKATIRCYPFEHNKDVDDLRGLKCFYSGDDATHMALFARNF